MSMKINSYNIWTIGCQMNEADSNKLASALDQLGLTKKENAEEADLVVLNSCVVRQSAEDKVSHRVSISQEFKKDRPDQMLVLMGCMVGPQSENLRKRFPAVDMFVRPQDFDPLLRQISETNDLDIEGCISNYAQSDPGISCHVPIIKGCDFMCSFCIIPYRRGRQVSRTIEDIVSEASILVHRGVKEITLLGQTVDAYGHDLDENVDLSDLLSHVNEVEGLERIRFLTSHPSFMSEKIIKAIRELPKVCEHINLPIQAGSDVVLERMRRPYTNDHYRRLVDDIRNIVPDVTISTDIIVGFPGESDQDFQDTMKIVEDIQFSKVHSAEYSNRPGTIASRQLKDDIPIQVKRERRKMVDALQQTIQDTNNRRSIGGHHAVLIEGRRKQQWYGRNRNDKLVYTGMNTENLRNSIVEIKIEDSSPWSLTGSVTKTNLG
ncbi:MAG: tRNA (N6-isopentenyl adenosine(37)-C2)-methylthiotransferase MiaB [SAR202 cluster bacterium]|nr:tRNA (N6-isopentenyl adenosine(37)-C2)-methylthiotransferase MiaB [SAR202 cluster bacterium]